ncbi:MAG: hypothetical protein U0793_03020 [Gemmataceae bacterium]
MPRARQAAASLAALALGCLGIAGLSVGQERTKAPVKVTVEAAKEERVDAELPVDPAPRLQLRNFGGNTFSVNIFDEGNRRLHLNHFPTVKIDGAVTIPGGGGIFRTTNAPLPKKGTKARTGYMNVWEMGELRFTQEVELIPSKAVDGKRRLDAAFIHYTVENIGKNPHKVGLRTVIDSFLVTTRNCKFAAPNHPGKLLDGIELKGRDVPSYVKVLQQPDLKNPGMVAHVAFNLGSGIERPERVLLTSALGRRDLWDLPVMPGGAASLIGFFWEPEDIRPGGRREFGYAYGTGLADSLSPDTNFKIDLGGSFEPGKTFTISALVTDPGEGQTLELELPKGLERVEGRQIQPVPVNVGEEPYSLVLWKGRVTEFGRFPIRVRASSGITRTKILTVAPGEG